MTNEVSLKNVGANIRKYRERRYISQHTMADALHLSRNVISNIELGKWHPSMVLARDIAKFLDVDVIKLFE